MQSADGGLDGIGLSKLQRLGCQPWIGPVVRPGENKLLSP